MPGAATQIFSREFETALERLPTNITAVVLDKIGEMGHRLDSFPHYRLTGRPEFRLRVGDYRVIYEFDLAKNELLLLTIANRREVYR